MADHRTDAGQVIFQGFLYVVYTLGCDKSGTDIDGILLRHIKSIAGSAGQIADIPYTLIHRLVNIGGHLLLTEGI